MFLKNCVTYIILIFWMHSGSWMRLFQRELVDMNYKKMDEFIGNSLFEARVVKRITQEDITDRINVDLLRKGQKKISRQTYANYEHGTYSIPQGTLEIACNILGLNWRSVFKEACDFMEDYISKKED